MLGVVTHGGNTPKEKSMPKRIQNTSGARPLDKARWMQTLDELESEYLAFQASSANTNSAQHNVRTSRTSIINGPKGSS
jgi:hypothetical protein